MQRPMNRPPSPARPRAGFGPAGTRLKALLALLWRTDAAADRRRPAAARRARRLAGWLVGRSAHDYRRAGLVEAGEVCHLDGDLLLHARVDIHAPPWLDQNAPGGRAGHGRRSCPRGRAHRPAGVARHDQPLQRWHAVRRRRFCGDGPDHPGADSDGRRGGGRALAPARSPRGPWGGRCGWDSRSLSSAPRQVD